MKLAVENASVFRGRRTVLEDVSLRFDSSGGVAVVGPNGAGKTTLLLTMLGLLRPTSGRVLMDDVGIQHIRRRDVARRLAFVPQSVEGYEGFAVRQVVEAGRFAHRHPLEPLNSDDRRIVAEAMARCAVSEFAERTLDTLSGGERQRVWLAAALAQQTPALLLDEPAASLDPAHQAQLVRILRALADEGRLVVTVAHDLNFAAAVAQRVVALRGGRIAFDGPMVEMLALPRLREVFDAAFSIVPRAGGMPIIAAEYDN